MEFNSSFFGRLNARITMSHTSPNGSQLPEDLQREQPETIASSDDNPIDPVTGLSQRERDYIQQSWHHVRQDLKAAGLGFFQAYGTRSSYHLFFYFLHLLLRIFQSFLAVPAARQ
jgi:hypothetical protein